MARYATRNLIKIMVKNKINLSRCLVGVLGITFKENCPDIRNSKIFDILKELQSWGVSFKVMDNWASKKEVKKYFNIDLSSKETFKNFDALIVAVGHNEYRKFSIDKLKKFYNSKSKLILADLKSFI